MNPKSMESVPTHSMNDEKGRTIITDRHSFWSSLFPYFHLNRRINGYGFLPYFDLRLRLGPAVTEA
jgi:hypothetical protein